MINTVIVIILMLVGFVAAFALGVVTTRLQVINELMKIVDGIDLSIDTNEFADGVMFTTDRIFKIIKE